MAISGFPDATTTGVPAGVTLTASGGLVINTPGVVIEGLAISGMVTINADNVTLKNCTITSGGWAVVNITSGSTGVVIQDCEINGLSAEGVRGISGQGTFLRNDIHHTEDGIYLTGSNTLIQDNYIHDLQSNWSGPHYDGIATDGGVSNITIRHNTIINPHGQTSALMLSNYFGSVTNVVVDNNWLEGGGYTVYSDGQFNNGTISGVSFTNNYLVKGQYGYSSIKNNTPVWEGNIQYTGQPVDTGGTLKSPTIVAISDDSGAAGDGITNDNTLTLTGTAAANSSVKVYDGGTLLGTVSAGNSGTWNFTTAALKDGGHSFTATATSGSTTSAASASKSITVDTDAPNAPTIASFSSDTGALGDGITSDNTLTLTGTAAANSSVKVYDGGTLLGTVSAGNSGTWSFNTAVLANGGHSFTAKATDIAGNTSGASAALAVTVTPPDAQAPSPPPSTATGFPDAKSTGLPDGVILTASGDVNVTKAGTVINALDVKGTIWIMADNVTVQNSRITSTDWTGIWIKPGVTGTVVKDNEILNVGSSKDGANGIFGSGTFLRNDIHDVENGINVTGASLIQDNYIHDMNAPNVRIGTVWGGPHYDGIEINGGVSDVVIRHNTIINDNGQTSAVMINNDFGPVSNIKVDGNFLAGGGYTLYSDGSFSSTDKISGVEFTNNELGQGHWGYYYFKGNTPLLSNNDELGTNWPTPDSSGGTPTNPQPGAPTITSFSNDTGTAGDGITSDNTIQLKGMAAAGSTVKVFDGSTLLGTTKASSTGSWEYLTAVLNDAKHVLTATATATSGQVSAASTALAVTVDTAAPIKPVVNSNTIVNANQVKLSGTAEANTKVTVYDGDTAVGTGTTSSTGAWSVTTNALSTGTHALTAKAMDAAGNVSGVSQSVSSVIGGTSTTTPGTVVESSGATTLVEKSDKFYLNNSSGLGPSLKYRGADFVDGTDGSWTPIGAEKTATGYLVAWKETSTGRYTAWNTDNNGNYVSHVSALTGSASGGSVSGTNSGLKSLETSFHQDLNGDGQIGASSASAPVASVALDTMSKNWSGNVTIKGIADANSLIKLYDGNASLETVKTAADGTWSFKTSSAASDTVHTYTAKQIDSSGQVVGTSGNAILGSTGSNTLKSTSGNDLFVGNGGTDTFVFAANFGKDVIKDFAAAGRSHDVIQFSKTVFDNFADVLSHATQVGQDVVISANASDSVTLKSTKLSAISSNDFHFA